MSEHEDVGLFGAPLPDYEDIDATRPLADNERLLSPVSSAAILPASEARIDPFVEVWAWLAEELRDESYVDAAGGLSQLAEIYALAGHADAAQDAARTAFESNTRRSTIARQFRQLAGEQERSAAALAEARSCSLPAARDHAYAHAWLSAVLSGAPTPPPLDDSPFSWWLWSTASLESSDRAPAEVMLAVDYTQRIRRGDWATISPAAALILAGFPKEPQKQYTAMLRLADACEGSTELADAARWLRAWHAGAVDGGDVLEAGPVAELLHLARNGDESLRDWFSGGLDPSTPDAIADDEERTTKSAFGAHAEGTSVARLHALLRPGPESWQALLNTPGIETETSTTLQSLLRDFETLSASEDARRSRIHHARRTIANAAAAATYRPWWEAFADSNGASSALRPSVSPLAPWAAGLTGTWKEHARALAEAEAVPGVATKLWKRLEKAMNSGYPDGSALMAELPEDERQLLHYLLGDIDELPAWVQNKYAPRPRVDELAEHWIARETTASWAPGEQDIWTEQALAAAPHSPWLQRYAAELRRIGGADIYERLSPNYEAERAEASGDLSTAVRLTLAALPHATSAGEQREIYVRLARLYTQTGETEKAAVCREEIAKRTSASDT